MKGGDIHGKRFKLFGIYREVMDFSIDLQRKLKKAVWFDGNTNFNKIFRYSENVRAPRVPDFIKILRYVITF